MRMKNRFLLILLTLALAVPATSQAFVQLMPDKQEAQAALLSAKILTHYQYEHLPLDDKLSAKIFDSYLNTLDGNRMVFLQADIDRFADDRTRLDDAILKRDLTIPFAIYNLYLQRITEHYQYARTLLKKGFDFRKKESFEVDRKDAPWAKSREEMDNLWRKRVKNDWLNLKLAGKSRKEIVKTLDRRYANILKSISSAQSGDVFQSFMNAYAMAIDPHTNYFGVSQSEDFDISMRLSLTGIGAVLFTKDDYTTVKDVLAGGPAALSGELKSGDRIVGVGQGKDGPITDIVGWRIDDAVALIRGPKDTVVRLDVLPAEAGVDGKHKLISLIRKKITLEKQAASKSIIKVKDGRTTHRIGVITLPSFYEDFSAHENGDKNYKSASRDVARLLNELKKDKVDGVLVDLRNNGGGSLSEAIKLTGLFINKGPVVQERNSAGKITVSDDEDADAIWTGPLGVLINRGSASASEIFTAAIQDYGRGVVIGSNSFGKGTVQTIADLDQIEKNDKPELGELKLTIAQFFRINGGSTQLRGVTPDVEFPAMAGASDFGESTYSNALPWSHIKAADYTPDGNLKSILPELIAKHDKRISDNRGFRFLQQDIAEIDKMRKKNRVSLNEAERRKEREAREAIINARKKAVGKGKGKDKDVLLDEAAHIVSDEATLLKTNTRIVAR
jgi:carboxyl-terminal processing protease